MLKVVGARLKGEEVAMLVSWHGRKLGRLKQSCQGTDLEAARPDTGTWRLFGS